MVGKKNIVFGFLFLTFSVALGPYMVLMYGDTSDGSFADSSAKKQQTVGRLQALKTNNYEEDLEEISPAALARANTEGILAINQLNNAEFAIDYIKGGPHAHGNLEAVLNIIVGIVLCFLAVSPLLKNIVSWMFILGTLLHSGVMYLERVFQLEFASSYLNSAIGPIGPLMIIGGIFAMAILVFIGFENRFAQD